MCLESCFSKFPDIKDCPVYIDGSNVAYSRKNESQKPSLDDVMLQINHLVDLKFDRENIHCICDPNLKYHIDKPIDYEVLVKEGIIIEAPKVADEFILSFALKHEFCFIISNDKFREYTDQLPSRQWLEDRRISFMFIGDNVCLSPNIDYKALESVPLKNDKPNIKDKKLKNERTTLDVLETIKESSGEFDLF